AMAGKAGSMTSVARAAVVMREPTTKSRLNVDNDEAPWFDPGRLGFMLVGVLRRWLRPRRRAVRPDHRRTRRRPRAGWRVPPRRRPRPRPASRAGDLRGRRRSAGQRLP